MESGSGQIELLADLVAADTLVDSSSSSIIYSDSFL